jgi:hypothetical protein
MRHETWGRAGVYAPVDAERQRGCGLCNRMGDSSHLLCCVLGVGVLGRAVPCRVVAAAHLGGNEYWN